MLQMLAIHLILFYITFYSPTFHTITRHWSPGAGGHGMHLCPPTSGEPETGNVVGRRIGYMNEATHVFCWEFWASHCIYYCVTKVVFNYTWSTCNVVNKPVNLEITSLENYYMKTGWIQWNVRNYWNKWVGLGRGQKIVAWPELDTGSPTDI